MPPPCRNGGSQPMSQVGLAPGIAVRKQHERKARAVRIPRGSDGSFSLYRGTEGTVFWRPYLPRERQNRRGPCVA